MAKWKIVEEGAAVNFEQVKSLHTYKDQYGKGPGRVDVGDATWSILADNVLVESGFETEADAVVGIAKLVKELEGGDLSINLTNPAVHPDAIEHLARRRGAFPGVDNV